MSTKRAQNYYTSSLNHIGLGPAESAASTFPFIALCNSVPNMHGRPFNGLRFKLTICMLQFYSGTTCKKKHKIFTFPALCNYHKRHKFYHTCPGIIILGHIVLFINPEILRLRATLIAMFKNFHLISRDRIIAPFVYISRM